MKGTFYGVGVGPGDPELLTLKGKRILETADCIAAPKTKSASDSTALQIAGPYIGDKEVLELVMPMTSDTDRLQAAWDEGAKAIMERLDMGKNVAFITLGDPSLFSTFRYVFRPIQAAGYDWEIIPGINAPSAAAARLGDGLADGKESLAILAATNDLERVAEAIRQFDNIVLMKGATKWQTIAALLEREGVTACTSAAERCTMGDERIFHDITNMPEDLSYFLTAIIRKGKEKK